jgi:hypothetical protein
MTADELRARILDEVKRTPSPTRASHQLRVGLIVGIGALATVGLFFAMGGFAPGTRPAELIAFTAGSALVAAIVLTRVASGSPGGSMLGRPAKVLVTASVIAAPILALGALVAAMCWPTAAAESVPESANLACAAMTVAQGALPLVILMVPRRGSDPIHPAITGAALGVAAGGWTAMMAYLRCPHAQALHCVLAHVAPTVILSLIGAVLGWVLLRVK